MNRMSLPKALLLPATCALLLVSCDKDTTNQAQDPTETIVQPASSEGDIVPGQYIVFMKENAIPPGVAYLKGPITNRAKKAEFMLQKQEEITAQLQTFLSEENISTDKVIAYYTSVVAGFAIKLNDEEFKRLSTSDQIGLLEHDRVEQLPEFTVERVEAAGARAQTTPCGITRAGGTRNGDSDEWIWIIDTGIDLDHPDLDVQTDPNYAKSFVPNDSDPNDCNGHGTHVAGTAGAINNNIGVVGVSAGAKVVPVKVFGCTGGSYNNVILQGIDHVGRFDLPGDVANFSLSGYYGTGCSTNSPYKAPLESMSDFGTRIALAAGNNHGQNANLRQPSCINYNNIYTIGSMTCGGSYSSFSNVGRSTIDFVAVGSSVYSTYKDGGYATLNGTSMATPHVAGIMHAKQAAPATSGNVIRNGVAYPIAVH